MELTFIPKDDWTRETLRHNISSYDASLSSVDQSSPAAYQEKPEEEKEAAQKKLFKKELYHYLRWALSAGAPGPGIPETMMILGQAECERRIIEAIELSLPDMERGLSVLCKSDPAQIQDAMGHVG